MKIPIKDLKKVGIQFKPKEEKDDKQTPGGGGGQGGSSEPPPHQKWKEINPQANIDPETPKSEELAQEWEKAVAEEAQKSAGWLPGGLKKALKVSKEKGEIDWKEKLREFLTELGSAEKTVLPNRRFVSQGDYFYTTKKESEGLGVAVIAIDTSGSMYFDPNILRTVINEAYYLFSEVEPEKIYLIFCDTTVYTPVETIEKENEFEIRNAYGGGGTTFKPPFVWIDKNIIEAGEKLGPVIYFTDGFPTSDGWPSIRDGKIAEYASNVFWVITYDAGSKENIKIPFGEKATLKIESKIK